MPESVSNNVARSALAARIYAALGDERRLSLLAGAPRRRASRWRSDASD